ncbi:TMEM165/GDT1 family protein [Halosimplex rubrum]|uniref:TMEM165/GDT1 family protein n=1 Tax=Halosimplex rubrum TaxID=869889 RepID=A0A7D5P669_9EURY|nr:TMEM165/GDT1 family protein [Halosimplex rubrum]QLH79424.1 TMEM165/GDT1 family protein [Halosimplex rubrum]
MSDFLAVMFAAMVAQLVVLPGEKVQFIIAGLATRFRPLTVVGAAGLAFAGWTALEIWFGQALKGALPPVYLDAVSGVLFLLFGVLLLRSIPEGARVRPGSDGEPSAEEVAAAETDGGYAGVGGSGDLDVSVLGRDVPDRFGNFLPIFALMAVGEFGDKTQLVTISLAVQYGAHPGIWVGEMLVIVPISLANAYFFSTFAGRFDAAKAHLFGASVFFFFGIDTFLAVFTGFSVWETVVGALAGVVQGAVGTVAVVAPALP